MKKLAEIKEYVEKNGRGTAFYNYVNTEPVYLSKGVREAFLGDGDIQEVINAVGLFQKGDFGTSTKAETTGHEYGAYESSIERAEGEDARICVHRDHESLIVYFAFER